MATAYRMDTGVRLRSYLVALAGQGDDSQLRALAHALVERETGEPLGKSHHIIAISDPFAPLPIVRSAPRTPSRAKWMLLGGAIVATGAGAALAHFDNQGRCGPTCPTIYPTKRYGYASLAVAGAVAVTTGYLFHRDARLRTPGAKWMLLGGAIVATGTGAALVHFDNQDRCGPTCPTIYPTKPYGYASLAAAGAMAATAGYLFYRDTRARPSSEQTTIGIAPARSGIFLTATGGF